MEAGILPKRSEISSNILYPLDRKSKAYSLFQKVQGAMHNVPDFSETCRAILDAVIDEMDAENCSLMLKDPISGDLAVCAARGRNEGKSVYYPDRSGKGKRFRSGEGIAGWVLKEGKAIMLNDVHQEPRFVSVTGLNNGHRNNRLNSLICFPIREKDQVVGVFNISHSKKGAFNEGDKLARLYFKPGGGGSDVCPFFLGNQRSKPFNEGLQGNHFQRKSSFNLPCFLVHFCRGGRNDP